MSSFLCLFFLPGAIILDGTERLHYNQVVTAGLTQIMHPNDKNQSCGYRLACGEHRIPSIGYCRFYKDDRKEIEIKMKAIERVPVIQQVVNSLKEYIMSGAVQVGDKLPAEMVLCEQLSVGRGTVREAMRILQATGFVVIHTGRGAFVARTKELEKEDLIKWFKENEFEVKDFLEVRAAIEPLAVKLAIRRAKPAELDALKSIQEKTLEAVAKNDIHVIALCDENFHATIVECSRNKLLMSINKQITECLKNFREKTFYIPSNAKNLIQPHAKILQAILDKDEQMGAQCMLEHLEWVRKDLEKSASS